MADNSESEAAAAPDFNPVPLRTRRDGWTPERQRAFIGHLHATRSISQAARAVGMRRETAYRLRDRPGAESFRAAWDAAFAWEPRPIPIDAILLRHRAFHGVAKPIIRGGRQVGLVIKPDNKALLKLHDRFERLVRRIDRRRGLQ